jgi:multicomponent Na+:H+ antiporter subunit C
MIDSALIYAVAGVALFSIGLSGVFFCLHPFQKILALNFAGCGNFLIIVALAGRQGGETTDPVPQALVLTGIVVAVSGSAVALTLYRRWVTLAEPQEISDAFEASLAEGGAPSDDSEPKDRATQAVPPGSQPEIE